ncbi:nitric oxide reductase transcriptional regulator NorR [Pigmentiphaga soli]|uniref:Nitric oxide reductase transcriptional regulator NorR n=1 Tax=Pigmentiphaga soli TaxID=1007095 RepID=A0ABP8GZD1_9BURK
MTRTTDVLNALVPLISDLAQELPAELRYRRLLDTLRRLLPCDAVALLRLEGDTLVPLATRGLSDDTLGRRFMVAAHPRLHAILQAPGAVRFAADCGLPDPYDGLIPGEGSQLDVHDCMGCTLRVGAGAWGVLTLDALETGRFSPADLKILDTFASLAAATVAATARLDALARSIEDERRRAESYRLAASPAPQAMVGHSPAYRQLVSEIELVAPSDLTVLVTGETGVGKELVARQLHARSPRADKAMVSVNCAALPEHLVESELFGHVRGAFSGAVGDRLGKFEMAHGGTLFLDEIGELPLAVQAKLLRVLQDGQLQRIGSDREHRADIRLVAATNRDLAAEVRAGRFRADLYHRLSVFPLRVPPLRERGRDVLLLAGAFIEENRRRTGLRGLRLSQEAQRALLAHAWPGNVRELEYLLARAALKAGARHAKGDASGIATLTAEDLDMAPPAPAAAPPADAAAPPGAPRADLRSEVDAFQRRMIEAALEANRGNMAASARALGLDRANLARLAARLGIVPAGRRQRA